MKKCKLLYFISEDQYFLTHKINQAKDSFALMNNIMVVSNFSNYENKIKKIGFETFNLKFNRKSINPLSNLILIFNFVKVVKKFNPDFIQCIALKPILLTIIASAFLKKKIKIICCVVGMGYLFINKNFSTYLLKVLYFTLLKIFFSKRLYFIFQNKDDNFIFKRLGFSKPSNTTIIRGSGVNIKKFKPKKIKKIYDCIFHSRILKDKGIFEIIDALKLLHKKKIFPKILILGSPDPGNYASVDESLLKKWKKENLIIWKPRVSDVSTFLQQSKISILPSYREGLPKSLLEAASCALPIIASNVPGCKEICHNEYNGFLVKPKDHKDLAKAIQKLINNKTLIKKFGENSRLLVEKNFSDQKISSDFRLFFKKLMLK